MIGIVSNLWGLLSHSVYCSYVPSSTCSEQAFLNHFYYTGLVWRRDIYLRIFMNWKCGTNEKLAYYDVIGLGRHAQHFIAIFYVSRTGDCPSVLRQWPLVLSSLSGESFLPWIGMNSLLEPPKNHPCWSYNCNDSVPEPEFLKIGQILVNKRMSKICRHSLGTKETAFDSNKLSIIA